MAMAWKSDEFKFYLVHVVPSKNSIGKARGHSQIMHFSLLFHHPSTYGYLFTMILLNIDIFHDHPPTSMA